MDIKRAWESTRENMKISSTESLGYYELKHHKSRFDEERSHQRKQIRLQMLGNRSKRNGDNEQRCETSKTLGEKKRENMKEKMSLKQRVRTKI
jgi:hypothetical protein